MSISTYNCEKGCCKICIQQYNDQYYFYQNKNRKKAGAFIYDPELKKVLLVQSRGQFWGFPKGSIEQDELVQDCAIREVKEETGISINIQDFIKATTIKKRATYYYIEMKCCDINLQQQEENDANGITWIGIDCLKGLILSGNIMINNHTRILFKKFLNICLPNSNFIKKKYNK
jgi:ADP-ribose pyrophosphatase YjhB (NUDIX family)